ncbi:putative flippase GtrA [Crossiella equi]|uniref:Flippase GtrA n=1 Tax=Crossiella equi TaxID=130796 RepID=A0ABS5ATD3_9PSEU|nr:GtrA family protein [Crossiella equi]MBP2478960.1 putative flippase GtrA [Crossiella equi]
MSSTAPAHPTSPTRTADQRSEFLKFAVVGALTWIIDTAVVYTLKLTILGDKPLTARAIGVIVATAASYLLNRSWSFNNRGGKAPFHEAVLFAAISAVGAALTLVPQAVSLYALHIRVPYVSPVTQAVANFVTGQILGVLLAMVFRFWAFRKFVFPEVKPTP